MDTNIRKYFSFDVSKCKNLHDDKEAKLIAAGYDLVKKFYAKKAKTSTKRSFAEIMDGVNTDGYDELNDKLVSKIVKYSMERAGFNTQNFELSHVANPQVHNTMAFKETFNAVLAQIITPVVPAMISAEFLDMADIANIGWGDTARFIVRSNDLFYVNRISKGINQGSIQRLYNTELTVNPEPYNIKTTVDWYQVAAGLFDLGEFVYKVGYSFNAYISQMVVGALSSYITAGAAANAAYITSGFTTAKFAALADRLQAANAGSKIRAYGTLSALQAVIPEGGAASGIANMQMLLGDEWSKIGYIGEYKGVDLVRIPQVLLPNTVNTTALFGVPNNVVYMFADGGYRPVKIVFEGQPITIDILPLETPDKQMGINVTMFMGTTLVAGSKFGAITDVALV